MIDKLKKHIDFFSLPFGLFYLTLWVSCTVSMTASLGFFLAR